MNFFSKKVNPSLVNSLVGPATVVKGDVSFAGGLRVEGTIEGSINGTDNSVLVLVNGGRITGSINVTHAIIDGPIEGPLVICETLELKPAARINGDITYKDLTIKAGAIINGRLIHNNPALQPTEIA